MPEHSEIRRLLLEVIDSFEKLEVLLALYAVRPAERAAAAVAAELRLPEPGVRDALADLCQVRVLRMGKHGGAVSFDEEGKWAAAVAALAALRESDRVEVLNLMATTALDRIRGNAARTFADAFVLRRDKKEDDDG